MVLVLSIPSLLQGVTLINDTARIKYGVGSTAANKMSERLLGSV
jgi:hypothetical protein